MLGQDYLFIGDTTGYVFKCGRTVYTDDGNAIPLRVKTKYYSLVETKSDLGVTKLLQSIQVFGDFPQGILVSYSKRDNEGTSDYDILGQVNERVQSLDIYEKGNAFSFGFDDYSGHSAQIDGFKIYYKDTKEII